MSTNSEIWIAEDDRSLRWVMEKAITRDGITVRSFESGNDLLQALKTAEPEIIISDIRMPGIDGLAAVKGDPWQSAGYSGHYHHSPLRPGQRGGRLSGGRV